MIETSARPEDVGIKHKTQLKKCNQLLTKNKLAINTEKIKSIFFGKSKICCKTEHNKIDRNDGKRGFDTLPWNNN